MPKELSEKLIQLGFTKNQAAVYSSLIELGQCKAGAIIKKTNLHRNIVYEALDDLVSKKLVFKTSKGGVALFQLSDATTLINDAEKQVSVAQEVSKEINQLRKKSPHEIKLYEGLEGLKSFRAKAIADLESTKDQNHELLVLGAGTKITQDLYDSFFKKDDKRRAAKDVPARMLFPHNVAEFAEKVDNSPCTQARLLPQNFTETSSIDIWKDHVAFMLYDAEPFIISIKNQQLATSFKEYFETLWNQDVFITNGLENVQKIFRKKMRDMKKGGEYVVLGANVGKEGRETLTSWFHQYHQERKERDIHVKLLAFEEDKERQTHEIIQGGDPEFNYCELRFMDKKMSSPMQINIYDDSIMMVYWALGEKAMAIEINKKEIRDAMLSYFNGLWSQDTRLHTGRQEMEDLLYRTLSEVEDGGQYYVYGGQYGEKNPDYIYDYYIKYHAERVKRKVQLQIVGYSDIQKKLVEEMKSADPKLQYTELRFLDREFSTPMFVHIYPKTAIIGIWDYDEAMAIETNRPAARKMLEKYFQTNWAIATP